MFSYYWNHTFNDATEKAIWIITHKKYVNIKAKEPSRIATQKNKPQNKRKTHTWKICVYHIEVHIPHYCLSITEKQENVSPIGFHYKQILLFI
jgi:hypothetical protein